MFRMYEDNSFIKIYEPKELISRRFVILKKQ